MKLRPYQNDCIEAVVRLYRQGCRSAIVVMATGLGKTVVACELARRIREIKDGRTILLAHRDHLCRQAARKLRSHTGDHVAIEIGDEWAQEDVDFMRSAIVVSTFQTQTGRKHRFAPSDFVLAICDESHHLPAKSYKEVIDYYRNGNPDMLVVGMTATPKRKDGLAMANIFTHTAYQYELIDAIRDGYLVEPHPVSCRIGNLDLSKVHNQGGDLNQKELDEALKEDVIIGMVHATIEQAYDLPMYSLNPLLGVSQDERRKKLAELVQGRTPRTTICFCVNKAKARRASELFHGWIAGSSRILTDEVKGDEREGIMQDHREGAFPFLCACMVPTEGYDCPRCSLIAIMRPTKSLALFSQMIGRCTRPSESIESIIGDLDDNAARLKAIAESDKSHSIVLDYMGNFGRHQLVRVVDVLGGDMIEEDRNRAAQLVDDGMGAADAVAAAQLERELNGIIDRQAEETAWGKELARMDERAAAHEQQAAESRVGASRYELAKAHLFGNGDNVAPLPVRNFDPPTDKQVWKLVSIGWTRDNARRLTKKQAMGVIRKWYQNQKEKATA
jgi:superfamily II DNA or RNA helicase